MWKSDKKKSKLLESDYHNPMQGKKLSLLKMIEIK